MASLAPTRESCCKCRDRIQLVIAGREYEWPCDFVDVPAAAQGRTPDPLLSLGVLGRAGFLDEFAFSLDSSYLILTRLGPFRRWSRRQLQRLWQACGMVHTASKPL